MALDRLPLKDAHPQLDLVAWLSGKGVDAVVVSGESDLESIRSGSLPDLALVDVSSLTGPDLRHWVRRCSQMKLPVVALVPPERVADLDPAIGIADFVLTPPNPDELTARARLAMRRATSSDDSGVIRAGDLAINPASYEVSMRGRRINLRFKEYELLRLLATNPGRVYSREALLSKIWGYDYFGGTRTVDVHIRRLRSKIEDADHPFIETIWNVGYRFRGLGETL